MCCEWRDVCGRTYRLTGGSGSELNPVEPGSRGVRIDYLDKLRSLGVKQDV